ncbi:hypothetical protein FKP32DRAFT_678467 [Trametes sanguinea]|nr:hypothetical protein FKP32DRAFT_678467 [Trametes sanguinea]
MAHPHISPKVQPSSTTPNAILLANQAVQDMGDIGSHTDGLETDDEGSIYLTAPEHNAIRRFNPRMGMVEPFIRDPAIQWPDTLSVVSLKSGGHFLYFTLTSNQLWLSPDYQNGTDLRTKPYAMFRVPIDGGRATQTDLGRSNEVHCRAICRRDIRTVSGSKLDSDQVNWPHFRAIDITPNAPACKDFRNVHMLGTLYEPSGPSAVDNLADS